MVGEKCASFGPWIEHRPYMTHQGGIGVGPRFSGSTEKLGDLQPRGSRPRGAPQTCMNHRGQHCAAGPGRLSCGYPGSHVSRHRLWKRLRWGHPGTPLCSVLPQIRPWPPANQVGSGTLVFKKANRALSEKHRAQRLGLTAFSPGHSPSARGDISWLWAACQVWYQHIHCSVTCGPRPRGGGGRVP